MKISQIILFASGAGLVAILFAFGKTRAPEKDKEQPGEMTETVAVPQNQITLNLILPKAKKLIQQIQVDSIEQLENQLGNLTNEPEKSIITNKLGKLWVNTGNTIIGGYYLAQSALSDDDLPLIKEAANYLFTGFQSTTDSSARIFGAQQSVEVYDYLISHDSSNLDYQVHEAICYMDGLGKVMEGVAILKKVEAINPDHIEMNLVLGRFGVISGQYDKAVVRLEKVVRLDPKNTEGYFQLAGAYRALGEKEKAIEALEKCKSLVNDPDFSSGIDNYIKQIKN